MLREIGMANFTQRTSRWQLQKNNLEFEINRQGSTEGNNCCWKKQGHLGICLSLPMEAFTSTNSHW